MNFARITRNSCLALLLVMASLPAVPQQAANRYTIEFLLFTSDGGGTEEGPSTSTLRSAVGEFEATPTTSRRLASAATRLRNAGGYQVIAHVAWSQPPAAWNSRRGVAIGDLGVSVPGLSGNVVLERGQYLHLGFDLKYEEGARVLQLSDLRRIKLDEALYFDHPQLGIIALVTSGG